MPKKGNAHLPDLSRRLDEGDKEYFYKQQPEWERERLAPSLESKLMAPGFLIGVIIGL